jgi:hypothetical protein
VRKKPFYKVPVKNKNTTKCFTGSKKLAKPFIKQKVLTSPLLCFILCLSETKKVYRLASGFSMVQSQEKRSLKILFLSKNQEDSNFGMGARG